MRCELAQNLLDAKELINLRLSWEQGVAVCDFTHDATDSPDVYLFSVVVTQEELRRSVPSSRNIIGKLGSRLVKLPRKSKVANFKLVVPIKRHNRKKR